MKKLLILSLVFILAIGSVQGQEKPFMTYYGISGGYGTTNSSWASIEIGCWGNKKPVMYGISADFVSDKSIWIGVKPYYQLVQAENYYLFTYFGPKINIKNKDYLFETGLMNYTGVNKNIYFNYGIGFQLYKEKVYPGLNLGLNLVIE